MTRIGEDLFSEDDYRKDVLEQFIQDNGDEISRKTIGVDVSAEELVGMVLQAEQNVKQESDFFVRKDLLHSKLYQLDWIQILQDAIEGRPNSWGYPTNPADPDKGIEGYPVNEWRNASDQLIAPIWKQLKHKLQDKDED